MGMIVSILWRGGLAKPVLKYFLDMGFEADYIVNTPRIGDRNLVEELLDLGRSGSAVIIVKEVREENLFEALLSIIQLYKDVDSIVIDPKCIKTNYIRQLLDAGWDTVLVGRGECWPHVVLDKDNNVVRLGSEGEYSIYGGLKLSRGSMEKVMDILLKSFRVDKEGLNEIFNIFLSKYAYLKAILIP